MRKLLILTMVTALLLTACSGLGSKGTLSFDAQSVDHIEISLGNGEYLTVSDRSDIADIVEKSIPCPWTPKGSAPLDTTTRLPCATLTALSSAP